jgi:hypothetical protein
LIVIEEVYKGDLAVGDTIRMLLPCAIGLEGVGESPTKVIRQIESGMEGIFMPWVYDGESYMEQNGAVLMLEDIAECGLADGMRWAFLSTKRGLVYDKNAYPGAKDAENPDDIEKYVILNFYCATKKQSETVKNLLDEMNAKYFVSESKNLL